MIRFLDMRQLPGDALQTPEASDTVFVGQAVDDRGRRSLDLARASGGTTINVSYDPETFLLTLDNRIFRVSDLDAVRGEFAGQRMLLDATTLDAVEILVLTRAFLNCVHPSLLSYLYVEPARYLPCSDEIGMDLAFSFADEFRGLKAVPGFANELRADEKGRLVACIGFEPNRLDGILQDDDGNFIHHTNLIFGIPAYQTSWEMLALLPHERIIGQHQNRCEIHYAGANNPKATFATLNHIVKAVAQDAGERLLVAPIGSKPSAIGVALFVCCRDDIRLKYDFPIRLNNKTEGIGAIHRYLVEKIIE